MRERPQRAAFALVEVLVGSVILAGMAVALHLLVEQSMRRVYQAELGQLAALYSHDVVARYGSVRPTDLERTFGRSGALPDVARGDPVLARAHGANPRLGALEPDMTYQATPGAPRTGHLTTRVDYEVGNRTHTVSSSTLVHGRRFPQPPTATEEATQTLGSRAGSAGMGPFDQWRAALVRRLESSPGSPEARLILPLVMMEIRTGHPGTDYAALLKGARTDEEILQALRSGLPRGRLPDGTYRVDWVTVGPVGYSDAPAGRTALRVLALERLGEVHRLLTVERTRFRDEEHVRVAGDDALDLGERALINGRSPEGVIQAATGTKAHVLATAQQLFIEAPRLSRSGVPQSSHIELTVRSWDSPVDSRGARPSRETVASLLGEAARSVGLTLGPGDD